MCLGKTQNFSENCCCSSILFASLLTKPNISELFLMLPKCWDFSEHFATATHGEIFSDPSWIKLKSDCIYHFLIIRKVVNTIRLLFDSEKYMSVRIAKDPQGKVLKDHWETLRCRRTLSPSNTESRNPVPCGSGRRKQLHETVDPLFVQFIFVQPVFVHPCGRIFVNAHLRTILRNMKIYEIL